MNSAKTEKNKGNFKIDFSAAYTKQYLEDLDPEYQALIRGQLSGKKKKPWSLRSNNMEKIKKRME